MADMALSLTKTAVEGTVGRVLAAIDEDTKLKAAAQQDLRFIVGEFQMMQSFLKVAKNNKESTSNELKKTWVRQLRELALDVEDCVEFVIHLDTTSAQARWSWVWRVVPLPPCMAPACTQHLDQAVAELKQLKARVEEVSQRNMRYISILGMDDSSSGSGYATPLLPPPVPPEQQLDSTAYPSTVDILRYLWKANGKQSSSFKCSLQHLVSDARSNKLSVISVWRAPEVDLEATHILDAAYCDQKICMEFKARARVKLMRPFNIQEFLKVLLNQLYVTSQQQDTLGADLSPAGHTSRVHEELRLLLSKHKYLIILEDLSSPVEWDLIKFYLPDLQNGSKIVILTQQLWIALLCTGKEYRVLQLAQFSNNDHRYLYAFYEPSGIKIAGLVEQLGQRRVISLWGDEGGDTASLVGDVFHAIKNKSANFKGVNFEEFVWFNFSEIKGVLLVSESWLSVMKESVRQSRFLIVIEGLQSKEDWDLIKGAGLVPEDTKSCIVIIANEETVAKQLEDNSLRKMDNDKEQEEAKKAALIGPLFAQKGKYYFWGHDDRFGSHGCSRRMQEALLEFVKYITPDQEQWLGKMVQNDKSNCGVKAVWGATGVGKSALLRLYYYAVMAYSLNMIKETELPKLLHKDQYRRVRFERFSWVHVPEPFDLAEFSRRLLLDFNSYDPGEMEETAVGVIQGHNPIKWSYEIIHKKKCLVVIDGMRSTGDWDSIKQALLGHHHPECSILVITTDESIAQHCVYNCNDPDQRTIHMVPLHDKSAFNLFLKIAKENREWKVDHDLKYAELIAPKCGGFPKIIDVVAKSPSTFWAKNINDDLVTILMNHPQFHHLRGVLSWMQSYIGDLSDSVKTCISYLSVFPTNYKIRKAHLLRRWIAEGYSRGTTGRSAKENAESLFDELVKLGIVQRLPAMPLRQTSGFFREYIISQPMEDNLVFALEGQYCKPNSQRTVQHLTIMKRWERDQKHVFESIDMSRLRSLTVYGEWQSFFIHDKMKRIRVLDLEGTYGLGNGDLELIFHILLSLKFICLRGCKSITCLPKSLGGLKQLESLEIRGTSIVTLPRAIIKLQKIRYIRAGCKFLPFEDWTKAASEEDNNEAEAKISQDKEADGSWTSSILSSRLSSQLPCARCCCVEVPEGIEKMPALHTLSTVNIKSARGMDFLKKLKGNKRLPQLLKLSVCGVSKKNWKDLCDVLSAHDDLKSLSLVVDEDCTELSSLNNAPKALRSLKLYGNVQKLPAWNWFENLKKFDLEVIISSQESMDQLVESLPRTGILRRICIKAHVTNIEFKRTEESPSPRVLKIDCSSTLEVAFQEKSIAREIQVLIIHCLKGSDFQISSNEETGIKNLSSLDMVWLQGYDDEKAAYVAHLKEQTQQHPHKPVFKFEKLKSA